MAYKTGDPPGRSHKVELQMVGDVDELGKGDISFTVEEEKKLVRKLDLW